MNFIFKPLIFRHYISFGALAPEKCWLEKREWTFVSFPRRVSPRAFFNSASKLGPVLDTLRRFNSRSKPQGVEVQRGWLVLEGGKGPFQQQQNGFGDWYFCLVTKNVMIKT